VDHQKIDYSKVKTHEEILKLIEDVRLAEAKVKNLEEFKKASYEQLTVLRHMEPPVKELEEPNDESQLSKPPDETSAPLQSKPKRSFLKRIQKPESPSEKKTKWFAFLEQEKPDAAELEPSSELEQQPEEFTIQSSTFVLQLDTNGNLVGFPMKKPHIRKNIEQGNEESEGEPEKGIKGKLKRLGSLFRRKKSEESESSGGIGEKIKGIFKRKNKEE